MPEIIQRSFTGGEIAPALRSRADLSKYTSGLALCENMFPRAQGGLYSRPGTKFVGELDDSDRRARLIPFSFNTDQTYILVFEHLKIRVIRDGGYVLDGLGPALYEITTPYTEDQLSRIGFTQSADVMTIVHPSHDVRNLSRTADDIWSLDVVDYSPTIAPPDWTTSNVKNISNITQANPAVVTTSTDHDLGTDAIVFLEGIGGMTQLNDRGFSIVVLSATTFLLKGEDSTSHSLYTSAGTVTREGLIPFGDGAGSFDKSYSYVITTVDIDGVESVASTVETISTASLSTTAAVRLSWGTVEGAAYYRVYKDPSVGTGIYGWIGNSETTQFDDYNIAPITSDAPPQLRAPFTDISGAISTFDSSTLIVTSVGHNLVSGETVSIDNIIQPVDFNGGEFPIQVIDDDNFKLLTSILGPFQPYTSGGTFLRAGGKPAVVNYYQQRQVFANTNTARQTVYTTQTGNFKSLRKSTPTRDDDAVTFTISAREVNEIRHIVEIDAMILLTSGGEWRMTEGQDEVLTPSTVGVRKQSNNGASWVPPAVVNDTVIYVQEKGARLRDLNYEFVNDRFRGNDLSIMAEHLFEGYEIQEMSYSDEPYGILWCVRDDGVLLGLTYQREHQIWAWHQHTTDGQFESVATITEDGRDAVYVIVKRTVDGSTKRYVERFEKRVVTSPEDVFCVDSGLTYDGVAVTTVSGLDHLEGETVVAVADGNVVEGLTVVSGAVTLPRAAEKISVGLSYTPVIETLDVDAASAAESLKPREIAISRVTIEVEKSRGGWVGPKQDNDSTGEMREIKPRFESDSYDTIALRTFKEEVILDPSWGRGGGLRIEQRSPLPFTILSVIPDVSIG